MTDQGVQQFEDVTVVCKANVYFDGKVISHTVLFKAGNKKTIGTIFPGSFTFNTGEPERMEIISGECRVRLAGEQDWRSYPAGTFFLVPGHSSFDIAVDQGLTEYICSFE
jgi:purine/pyrimidine-nucleoside phosphorylase